jgi:protein-tyrosine phosphatase
MAMGIFNVLAEKNGIAAHAVSCGVSAYPSPATEYAVKAAQTYGADISGHISCHVSDNVLRNADRIYGMTISHVRALQTAFPQYKNKIFPIADYDIPDPFGGSLKDYEETAERIHQAVEDIVRSMERIHKRGESGRK